MKPDWTSPGLKPGLQLALLAALAIITVLVGLADGHFSLRTPDRQGYAAYQRQDYGSAAAAFADPQWQAVALYRQGEFKRAASLFAGYDTAEAAYNHGNALVMLGNYQAAAERYSRALQLRPGWQAAEDNRRLALARGEALKREGGDMTGGKMGADDFVFGDGKSPSSSSGDEQVSGGEPLGDAALRSIWLRQVQTKPADFLRAKFAYQFANRDQQPSTTEQPE